MIFQALGKDFHLCVQTRVYRSILYSVSIDKLDPVQGPDGYRVWLEAYLRMRVSTDIISDQVKSCINVVIFLIDKIEIVKIITPEFAESAIAPVDAVAESDLAIKKIEAIAIIG